MLVLGEAVLSEAVLALVLSEAVLVLSEAVLRAKPGARNRSAVRLLEHPTRPRRFDYAHEHRWR